MRDGLKTIAAPEATDLAPLNECYVLMHYMKCMTGSINSTLGHPGQSQSRQTLQTACIATKYKIFQSYAL